MFDDVGCAYALTTHKAQGSTIDYVFLDVNDMKGCSDRLISNHTFIYQRRFLNLNLHRVCEKKMSCSRFLVTKFFGHTLNSHAYHN